MTVTNASEIKVQQKTNSEIIMSTKYSLRSNKTIAVTYGIHYAHDYDD